MKTAEDAEDAENAEKRISQVFLLVPCGFGWV